MISLLIVVLNKCIKLFSVVNAAASTVRNNAPDTQAGKPVLIQYGITFAVPPAACITVVPSVAYV